MRCYFAEWRIFLSFYLLLTNQNALVHEVYIAQLHWNLIIRRSWTHTHTVLIVDNVLIWLFHPKWVTKLQSQKAFVLHHNNRQISETVSHQNVTFGSLVLICCAHHTILRLLLLVVCVKVCGFVVNVSVREISIFHNENNNFTGKYNEHIFHKMSQIKFSTFPTSLFN